jgi:hypothetical protein
MVQNAEAEAMAYGYIMVWALALMVNGDGDGERGCCWSFHVEMCVSHFAFFMKNRARL